MATADHVDQCELWTSSMTILILYNTLAGVRVMSALMVSRVIGGRAWVAAIGLVVNGL